MVSPDTVDEPSAEAMTEEHTVVCQVCQVKVERLGTPSLSLFVNRQHSGRTGISGPQTLLPHKDIPTNSEQSTLNIVPEKAIRTTLNIFWHGANKGNYSPKWICDSEALTSSSTGPSPVGWIASLSSSPPRSQREACF